MEEWSVNEIHISGFEVLVKNPVPADSIWFIKNYTDGCGDYTKKRNVWLKKWIAIRLLTGS